MGRLVQQNEGTDIVFAPAAATDSDVTFDVDDIASGAGQQSAQHDFGVDPRARRFTWRAFVQFATAPVVGELVRIYLKTQDTVGHPDNDDGTGDAAVSAEDKLRNLRYIGSIVVDQAAINIEMVASGDVEISQRYVQVVFWNATADAFTADNNENGFSLTPVPDEIQ